MALSADRLTNERSGEFYDYPIAAASEIFMGGLTVLDASGNAEAGATATGKVAVGRAEEYKNNTGAAAADNIKVKAGEFHWLNSSGDPVTKANIGDTVYIEDDETVCATAAGKSAAGVMTDIDSTGVWVETRPPVTLVSGLTAANNLSDVGSATTSATNLGLGTGDTPTWAGATFSTTAPVCTGGVNPGPGTAGILKTAKTSITAAQLKALAASPITCVAAVANKMHCFLGAHLKLEYGSEVLVEPSAPDEPQFKYVDGSGKACSATIDATLIIVPAADTYAYVPATQVEGATLAELVNVPIVLHNTGGEYTGNASDDTVLEVTVIYMELDVS